MATKIMFAVGLLFALWVPFELVMRLDQAVEIVGEIRMNRAFDPQSLSKIARSSETAGVLLVGDILVTSILAFFAYERLFGRTRTK